MKRLAIASVFTVAAVGMAAAQAEAFVDNARVRNVEPQYENVVVPRQQCSSQWVQDQRMVEVGRDRNYAGVALGGIAGGVLGNQVGRGSGRAVATAVGAVVGALVGDRVSHAVHTPSYEVAPREITTCQTVNDVQPRIAGYRVAYDYHGQVYNTVMAREPGPYVQVRVSVEPIAR